MLLENMPQMPNEQVEFSLKIQENSRETLFSVGHIYMIKYLSDLDEKWIVKKNNICSFQRILRWFRRVL